MANNLPKRPRPLTPCEIQEIEDAFEAVSREIERVFESRDALSRHNQQDAA
ncbi:hypothetical protein ES703_89509 [subsurface metagenome]